MFRCPMPHKLAEAKYPGTVDEKLRDYPGCTLYLLIRSLQTPISSDTYGTVPLNNLNISLFPSKFRILAKAFIERSHTQA
jgi:hypothetical protein